MGNTALVTGTDRGLGNALAAGLLQRGWNVVAGHLDDNPPDLAIGPGGSRGDLYPVRIDVADDASVARAAEETRRQVGSVDMVINNAGVLGRNLENDIRTGLDYESAMATLNVNAFGPLRVVEHFIALMDSSPLKRLCFISSEAGCLTRSYRTAWYGYCVSKTALNMGVSIMFNDLRPDGFTFRLYHPGWMRTYMRGEKDTRATLEPAEAAELAMDYFLADGVDESRLVLRDNEGNEWPW
jgi:NAD(P)-dependent dehydrogenase (short-subunit alcohol dehydrogenase family)